jgi:hypothetical protein
LKICIACGEPKPTFSQEHLVPEAMGGKLCSDMFKTRRVCRGCNSTLGLFVDRPFLKNWFVMNDAATAGLQFADLDDAKSWTPLSFMGLVEVAGLAQALACELWLGPSGELAYHVHRADDPRWDSMAGGNPIRRKADPGRVHLMLTHGDSRRAALFIRSARHAFGKAVLHPGNFSVSDPAAFPSLANSADANAVAELSAIKSAAVRREAASKMSIEIGFEQRFMAKLALGLGFNLLGEPYLDTAWAARCRAALWERDPDKRAGLLAATSFFDEGSEIRGAASHIALDGVYTFAVLALGACLALILTLPSGRTIAAQISDEPVLWAGPSLADCAWGRVFYLAPQVNFFHGPSSMPAVLQHKRRGPRIEELARLESKRRPWTTLPRTS